MIREKWKESEVCSHASDHLHLTDFNLIWHKELIKPFFICIRVVQNVKTTVAVKILKDTVAL